MIIRFSLVLAAALACSGFPVPVPAHHSTAAEFDTHKPITFSGIVKKVQWMNPHIYTHIEVKKADGNTVVYRVEGGPPNALYRKGWRVDSLKAGDRVTVSGFLAKNEESMHIGQATITTVDGRRVFVGMGPSRVAAS